MNFGRMLVILFTAICTGFITQLSGAQTFSTLNRKEGDLITLSCSLTGNYTFPGWYGPPSLTQYTEQDDPLGQINATLSVPSRLAYAANNQDLLLSEAQQIDSGDYQCSYTGLGNHTVRLTVTEKTTETTKCTLLTKKDPQTFPRHDSCSFSAYATTYPPNFNLLMSASVYRFQTWEAYCNWDLKSGLYCFDCPSIAWAAAVYYTLILFGIVIGFKMKVNGRPGDTIAVIKRHPLLFVALCILGVGLGMILVYLFVKKEGSPRNRIDPQQHRNL